MSLKRQLLEGGDHTKFNKRLHSVFEGRSRVQTMEEFAAMLEPYFREWVAEEVNQAFQTFFSGNEAGSLRSESRKLWLQIDSKLPNTLFTGNKIVSDTGSRIKISLFDPGKQETVTSGPLSSMKVGVVVVTGDFDAEEWSKREFNGKVVESREGKRPLITGELIVFLRNGEGYIKDLCFTDNSSWIRSGKFRLGVRVHSGSDETDIREGISNAFKVKDHRGECYQKMYPPSLNSEVWRLEKIAKGGAYHKQLTKLGITNVGDFLRRFAVNQIDLRAALPKISNKKWEKIIAHATTCILDGKEYIYRDVGGVVGTALVFNSIYSVIRVTFDGQTYHPLDNLDAYQMRRVEDAKQRAYGNLNIGNLNSWEGFEDGQGEVEIVQMNKHEAAHGSSSSFEVGESSQGFNLAFSNSFGVADYMEPRLSPQDFDIFEEH